mgnify:CR=1 FL=1
MAARSGWPPANSAARLPATESRTHNAIVAGASTPAVLTEIGFPFIPPPQAAIRFKADCSLSNDVIQLGPSGNNNLVPRRTNTPEGGQSHGLHHSLPSGEMGQARSQKCCFPSKTGLAPRSHSPSPDSGCRLAHSTGGVRASEDYSAVVKAANLWEWKVAGKPARYADMHLGSEP